TASGGGRARPERRRSRRAPGCARRSRGAGRRASGRGRRRRGSGLASVVSVWRGADAGSVPDALSTAGSVAYAGRGRAASGVACTARGRAQHEAAFWLSARGAAVTLPRFRSVVDFALREGDAMLTTEARRAIACRLLALVLGIGLAVGAAE